MYNNWNESQPRCGGHPVAGGSIHQRLLAQVRLYVLWIRLTLLSPPPLLLGVLVQPYEDIVILILGFFLGLVHVWALLGMATQCAERNLIRRGSTYIINVGKWYKRLIKMYISTMNNILGLNLIIVNARIGALSICRGLSEGLRGTELSSLENIPDH